MKKLIPLFWSSLLFLNFTSAVSANFASKTSEPEFLAANPTWELSIHDWNITGDFDYRFYWLGQSRLLSLVTFPQDQRMTLLKAKYTPSNKEFYITMQFGQTNTNIKGRGSDSDWQKNATTELTDYGEMDSYGNQNMLSLDIGKVISQDQNQQTSVLIGLINQETNNQLRNVVYYKSLYEGKQYEYPDGLSQADDGSYLNGKFRGIRLGIEREQHWNQWSATSMFALTGLETKAYGHWIVAQKWWENTGYTIGFMANLGVKYAINPNLSTELSYFGTYAKNYLNDYMACDEVFKGDLSGNDVTLSYIQHGFRLGVNYRF